MKNKSPLELNDEDLEECIDGCTNLDQLRTIIKKPGVLCKDNTIDTEYFAHLFQIHLEGFAEDEEASQNNYEWGICIAKNINNMTKPVKRAK